MSVLQQWMQAQADPQVPVNENFVALEHMAVYGKNAATTAGLTWGYLGGRWGGFSIAAGIVVLMANATSYIVVKRVTGALSVSTAATNWNDTEAYARVYKLTTGAATVTAVEDWRAGEGGVHGGGSGSGTNLLNAVNVFNRNQSVKPKVLGNSGVIPVDASLSNNFGLTLSGAATLANPSNLTDGMELHFIVRQDAAGGRTLAYGDKYRWPGGTAPVLSTAAYAVDLIRARYDGVTGLLLCTIAKGFDATPVSLWPSITSENAAFKDEGTATTGWTPTGGTTAVSGSLLRLTKSTTSGCNMTKPLTFTPSGRDFILYGKVRASYATGDGSVFSINDGSKEISLWIGYDGGASARGAIYLGAGTIGSTTYVRANTGDTDYSVTHVEFALQYDSKFKQVNYWLRESDGRWRLGARAAVTFTSATQILVAKNSFSPVGSWVEFDYLTLCQPNIIAIGDSHCSGSTLFNPDRSLALSNDDSTWMRNFTRYSALRNNLVVNKGVGAQTSAQIQARIAEATREGPQLVVLHASSNDQANSISKADRTTSIQSTVAAAAAAGQKTVLLNALYGTSAYSGNPAHRDYMKDWWDTVSATVGAHACIDIMTPVQSGGYVDAAQAQADNVHLNPAGYALIGAQLSNP